MAEEDVSSFGALVLIEVDGTYRAGQTFDNNIFSEVIADGARREGSTLCRSLGDACWLRVPRNSLQPFDPQLMPCPPGDGRNPRVKLYKRSLEEVQELLDGRAGVASATSHQPADQLRPETWDQDMVAAAGPRLAAAVAAPPLTAALASTVDAATAARFLRSMAAEGHLCALERWALAPRDASLALLTSFRAALLRPSNFRARGARRAVDTDEPQRQAAGADGAGQHAMGDPSTSAAGDADPVKKKRNTKKRLSAAAAAADDSPTALAGGDGAAEASAGAGRGAGAGVTSNGDHGLLDPAAQPPVTSAVKAKKKGSTPKVAPNADPAGEARATAKSVDADEEQGAGAVKSRASRSARLSALHSTPLAIDFPAVLSSLRQVAVDPFAAVAAAAGVGQQAAAAADERGQRLAAAAAVLRAREALYVRSSSRRTGKAGPALCLALSDLAPAVLKEADKQRLVSQLRDVGVPPADAGAATAAGSRQAEDDGRPRVGKRRGAVAAVTDDETDEAAGAVVHPDGSSGRREEARSNGVNSKKGQANAGRTKSDAGGTEAGGAGGRTNTAQPSTAGSEDEPKATKTFKRPRPVKAPRDDDAQPAATSSLALDDDGPGIKKHRKQAAAHGGEAVTDSDHRGAAASKALAAGAADPSGQQESASAAAKARTVGSKSDAPNVPATSAAAGAVARISGGASTSGRPGSTPSLPGHDRNTGGGRAVPSGGSTAAVQKEADGSTRGRVVSVQFASGPLPTAALVLNKLGPFAAAQKGKLAAKDVKLDPPRLTVYATFPNAAGAAAAVAFLRRQAYIVFHKPQPSDVTVELLDEVPSSQPFAPGARGYRPGGPPAPFVRPGSHADSAAAAGHNGGAVRVLARVGARVKMPDSHIPRPNSKGPAAAAGASGGAAAGRPYGEAAAQAPRAAGPPAAAAATAAAGARPAAGPPGGEPPPPARRWPSASSGPAASDHHTTIPHPSSARAAVDVVGDPRSRHTSVVLPAALPRPAVPPTVLPGSTRPLLAPPVASYASTQPQQQPPPVATAAGGSKPFFTSHAQLSAADPDYRPGYLPARPMSAVAPPPSQQQQQQPTPAAATAAATASSELADAGLSQLFELLVQTGDLSQLLPSAAPATAANAAPQSQQNRPPAAGGSTSHPQAVPGVSGVPQQPRQQAYQAVQPMGFGQATALATGQSQDGKASGELDLMTLLNMMTGGS